MPDYERVLYFTMWGHWDDLFTLMIKTEDDFLAKKIEQFLEAYHNSTNEQEIVSTHTYLMQYVDHALSKDVAELIKLR